MQPRDPAPSAPPPSSPPRIPREAKEKGHMPALALDANTADTFIQATVPLRPAASIPGLPPWPPLLSAYLAASASRFLSALDAPHASIPAPLTHPSPCPPALAAAPAPRLSAASGPSRHMHIASPPIINAPFCCSRSGNVIGPPAAWLPLLVSPSLPSRNAGSSYPPSHPTSSSSRFEGLPNDYHYMPSQSHPDSPHVSHPMHTHPTLDSCNSASTHSREPVLAVNSRSSHLASHRPSSARYDHHNHRRQGPVTSRRLPPTEAIHVMIALLHQRDMSTILPMTLGTTIIPTLRLPSPLSPCSLTSLLMLLLLDGAPCILLPTATLAPWLRLTPSSVTATVRMPAPHVTPSTHFLNVTPDRSTMPHTLLSTWFAMVMHHGHLIALFGLLGYLSRHPHQRRMSFNFKNASFNCENELQLMREEWCQATRNFLLALQNHFISYNAWDEDESDEIIKGFSPTFMTSKLALTLKQTSLYTSYDPDKFDLLEYQEAIFTKLNHQHSMDFLAALATTTASLAKLSASSSSANNSFQDPSATGRTHNRASSRKSEKPNRIFNCSKPYTTSRDCEHQIILCMYCGSPDHKFCTCPGLGKYLTQDPDSEWSSLNGRAYCYSFTGPSSCPHGDNCPHTHNCSLCGLVAHGAQCCAA
ncbi:hypothetical protein D9615_003514 [Tricholomella constricta]|uniref:C3H1-type domain-containing protein n=1 Tax=Tricholomella constricta TaxID=117010 RepID=A0A8H5M7G2_9AGAR|nr:hypothetical protein D9615_003514 [Tricholomella constricta]